MSPTDQQRAQRDFNLRTTSELNSPGANLLSPDELFAVWDWLRQRDFTDDQTIPLREDHNG